MSFLRSAFKGSTTKPKHLTRLAIWALLVMMPLPGLAKSPLEKGQIAPNWMLQTANDEWLWLYKSLPQQSVTVLFFWASWCEQCTDLLPKMQAIAAQNPAINVLTLNVWETQDAAAHLEALNINLTLLLKAESVAQRYNIIGTPGFVVISQAREILYIDQGANKMPNLLGTLTPFLVKP